MACPRSHTWWRDGAASLASLNFETHLLTTSDVYPHSSMFTFLKRCQLSKHQLSQRKVLGCVWGAKGQQGPSCGMVVAQVRQVQGAGCVESCGLCQVVGGVGWGGKPIFASISLPPSKHQSYLYPQLSLYTFSPCLHTRRGTQLLGMTNKPKPHSLSLPATSQGHPGAESAGTSAHCLQEQELTAQVPVTFSGGAPPPRAP